MLAALQGTAPHRGSSAVVVGAGIAGLAAAHALAELGYALRVVERGRGLSDEGAGLTLWPNAVRALRSLGLEHVLDSAHRVPEAITMRPDGGVLARMPLAQIERRFGPLLSVHRGD